jgi:hypothetical protein
MSPRRKITAAEANHAAELEGVKYILWYEDPERGPYAVGRQYHSDDEKLIVGSDEPSNFDHITDTTNDMKRYDMYDDEHQKPDHEKKQKSEHERTEESKPEKEQEEETDAVECESEVKDK